MKDWPRRAVSFSCVVCALLVRVQACHMPRLIFIVTACTFSVAVAGAELPVFESIVDYCVSSRWGYSCFRPLSSAAGLDLSNIHLPRALVNAMASLNFARSRLGLSPWLTFSLFLSRAKNAGTLWKDVCSRRSNCGRRLSRARNCERRVRTRAR